MAVAVSLIENIYAGIKTEVCGGTLLPGQRVNITDMSTRHLCSKSTVRSALNRLVGEGLLEVHTNDGFYRPLVTEQTVRDQYAWNRQVLLLGLEKAIAEGQTEKTVEPFAPSSDPVTDIEHFFTLVAGLGDSDELLREIRRLNDLLHPLRLQKWALPMDSSAELMALAAAWTTQNHIELRRLIVEYHQRRLDIVPQIVALAYRSKSDAVARSALHR